MSKSKVQELCEAIADQAFKKEYADHLASRAGRPKAMSEIRKLVDNAAASLREDFGPEDYDDLLRYAAFVEVFKRQSEDNLRELTQTLIQHKRLLELLESDVADGALKDKIVALLQDTPIIGRTIDAGKRHGERLRSKAGATARHANDPKQAEKLMCKAIWDECKSNPAITWSFADIARRCIQRHPELRVTERTITGWCSGWEKGAKKG